MGLQQFCSARIRPSKETPSWHTWWQCSIFSTPGFRGNASPLHCHASADLLWLATGVQAKTSRMSCPGAPSRLTWRPRTASKEIAQKIPNCRQAGSWSISAHRPISHCGPLARSTFEERDSRPCHVQHRHYQTVSGTYTNGRSRRLTFPCKDIDAYSCLRLLVIRLRLPYPRTVDGYQVVARC